MGAEFGARGSGPGVRVFAGRYELVDRLDHTDGADRTARADRTERTGRTAGAERTAGAGSVLPTGHADAVWRIWDRKAGGYLAGRVISHLDAMPLLRFMRQQSGRLHDPHVLTPLGWAGEGDAVLFTMPLVRGGSVAALARERGSLPVIWVAEVLDQALAALAAAHASGIVHGDLRATRLLLEPTGMRRPLVRLSGFGLAAATGAPTEDLPALGAVVAGLLVGRAPGGAPGVSPTAERAAPLGVPAKLWDLLARLSAEKPGDRPADARAARAELAGSGGVLAEWSEIPAGWIVEVAERMPAYPEGWGPRGPLRRSTEHPSARHAGVPEAPTEALAPAGVVDLAKARAARAAARGEPAIEPRPDDAGDPGDSGASGDPGGSGESGGGATVSPAMRPWFGPAAAEFRQRTMSGPPGESSGSGDAADRDSSGTPEPQPGKGSEPRPESPGRTEPAVGADTPEPLERAQPSAPFEPSELPESAEPDEPVEGTAHAGAEPATGYADPSQSDLDVALDAGPRESRIREGVHRVGASVRGGARRRVRRVAGLPGADLRRLGLWRRLEGRRNRVPRPYSGKLLDRLSARRLDLADRWSRLHRPASVPETAEPRIVEPRIVEPRIVEPLELDGPAETYQPTPAVEVVGHRGASVVRRAATAAWLTPRRRGALRTLGIDAIALGLACLLAAAVLMLLG